MLAPRHRPTAMCTALSSKRSPQAERGNACIQSPLCGALTACSRALPMLSLRLLVRMSRSDVMCACPRPTVSERCRLRDKVVRGQMTKYSSLESLLGPTITLRSRSSCSSVSVPAADVRKAEGASEVTRRTPSPPSLTGSLAWSHWRSVRSKLVMAQTPFLYC